MGVDVVGPQPDSHPELLRGRFELAVGGKSNSQVKMSASIVRPEARSRGEFLDRVAGTPHEPVDLTKIVMGVGIVGVAHHRVTERRKRVFEMRQSFLSAALGHQRACQPVFGIAIAWRKSKSLAELRNSFFRAALDHQGRPQIKM